MKGTDDTRSACSQHIHKTPFFIVCSTSVLETPEFSESSVGVPPQKLTNCSSHTSCLRIIQKSFATHSSSTLQAHSCRLITIYLHASPKRRLLQERNIPQPGLAKNDSHHLGICLAKTKSVCLANIILIGFPFVTCLKTTE